MLLLFELHYIFQVQDKNLPFSNWDMSVHWILMEWLLKSRFQAFLSDLSVQQKIDYLGGEMI